MSKNEFSELTERFRRLGAQDPEGWARSQVDEGIPQLARFLFLRQAWRSVVPEHDPSWIASDIAQATRFPNTPYGGAGRALARLRQLGASDSDLTDLVRAKQAELLFSLCHLLAGPSLSEPDVDDVAWALVQIDQDGNILGEISALHESVLETDPSGREARPRPDT
jgi:hypothetical protein